MSATTPIDLSVSLERPGGGEAEVPEGTRFVVSLDSDPGSGIRGVPISGTVTPDGRVHGRLTVTHPAEELELEGEALPIRLILKRNGRALFSESGELQLSEGKAEGTMAVGALEAPAGDSEPGGIEAARSWAARLVLRRVSQVALSLYGEKQGAYVATSRLSAPMTEEHVKVLSSVERMSSAESLTLLVDVLRLVNLVQDGTPVYVGLARSPTLLSDQYTAIVKGNIVWAAAGADQQEQRRRFEQAYALLYVEDDSGADRKTEAYAHYTSVKTELLTAQTTVAELRLQLRDQEGSDPELEQLISLHDEIISAKKEILADLDRRFGFEEAIAIVEGSQLGTMPPSVESNLDLLEEASQITDAVTGDNVVPCDFSPRFMSEENWTAVRLDRDELRAAAEQGGEPEASANLEAIESIHFEVQLLTVVRPWMWEGLFESRRWRWRFDRGTPVSDGRQPPTGLIPAYVKGLVFVRNLRVRASAPVIEEAPSGEADPRAGKLLIGNMLLRATAQPKIRHRILRSADTDASSRVRSDRTAPVSRGRLTGVSRRLLAGRRFAALRILLIKGTVRSAPEKPLSGVRVEVTDREGRRVGDVLTKEGGAFSVTVPRKGRYTVRAEKEGHDPVTETVEVDRIETLTLTLRPRRVRGLANARVGLRPRIRASVLRRIRDARLERPGRPALVGAGGGDDGEEERPSEALLTVRLSTTLPPGETPDYGETSVLVEAKAGSFLRRLQPDEHGKAVVRVEAGTYSVQVHSEDFDVIGEPSREIEVTRSTVQEFRLSPKHVLENDETHLVAFVCRRVPRSPDPDENAIWPDL